MKQSGEKKTKKINKKSFIKKVKNKVVNTPTISAELRPELCRYQWGDSLEVRSLLTIEMPGNVHLEYSIKDCNKWHNYWTVVVVDGKLVAERSGVECL